MQLAIKRPPRFEVQFKTKFRIPTLLGYSFSIVYDELIYGLPFMVRLFFIVEPRLPNAEGIRKQWLK